MVSAPEKNREARGPPGGGAGVSRLDWVGFQTQRSCPGGSPESVTSARMQCAKICFHGNFFEGVSYRGIRSIEKKVSAETKGCAMRHDEVTDSGFNHAGFKNQPNQQI
jgi:hypothetical protein